MSKPRDSGYMLLVLMLAVAVLTITMLGVARNYKRGIQRDREVEMIHRGEQYERAVKRYYKKFGNYPMSIEQLENSNNLRFLRKRYKDPMSPDGEWKIAHQSDIVFKGPGGLTPTSGATAGTTATGPAGAGAASAAGGFSLGNSTTGGSAAANAATAQTASGDTSGNANASANQSAGGTAAGSSSTDTGATTGTTGTSSTGTTATGTNNATGTSANGNPLLGGGPMIGVVSKVKTSGIHSFGDKSKYSEWFFIYDPSQDTNNGRLLVGPYNPNMFVGSSALGNKGSSSGSTSGGTTGGTGNATTTTGSGAPNTGSGSTSTGSPTPIPPTQSTPTQQ